MSHSILATKLYVPPPRSNAIFRPRLIERLNEGLHRPLTLISAPAGFGKTTLVSEWIAGCEQISPTVRAAWLSLDEGDNDPTRFLMYLVAALERIAPVLVTGILPLLQSSSPPEALLMVLLNDIISIPDPIILILDDYHLIDAKPIDDILLFLVEHLPPQMHLVITTREDPGLPLARLRVRGQLVELRASDLRFNAAEAAEFLNDSMELDLAADDILALENRTEGWIAGLQLAALSLQGHQDRSGFIQSFAGDHRYIVDYLVEEVLERQPECIRRFLLQTAILDRLNGSLCDAVTGQQDGSARLEALVRGNLFVVPLDDKRQWYRYHHLFAQVLLAHLIAEQRDLIAVLHRRASAWYEQHQFRPEAIHHALAAEDFERAAHLIELAVPDMQRSRQEAALIDWLRALPDDLLRVRPLLSVHYAGALLQSGQLEGVEDLLRDAELWLGSHASEMDSEELSRLPGSIAQYRAAIALIRGDVDNTMKYARLVLDIAPEDQYLVHAAAAGLLGLAYWTRGDLEAGYQWYTDCMTRLLRIRHISDVIGCSLALGDIRIGQGRLREAMRIYERGLQLATEQGGAARRGAADMVVGMSEIYRERDELEAAGQCLQKNKDLGEYNGLPQNRYRWRVAMAHIREVQGDLEGALKLLHEAERLYMSDFFPNVRPIAARRARLWIAQGRLDEAFHWAREQSLSTDDELSYLREFEHITLARLLLADQSIPAALELLDRMWHAADAGGRTGSIIEIRMLQALAHQRLGDIPAALGSLEHALTLAEREGYVRLFVDEGLEMERLLHEAAAHEIRPNYTDKLLQTFHKQKGEAGESHVLVSSPLPEPLSQRELEILRLFKTDLSGPEIARELVIALSTVRTHTKSIYSKLNVNSRRMAVKRADELNLL